MKSVGVYRDSITWASDWRTGNGLASDRFTPGGRERGGGASSAGWDVPRSGWLRSVVARHHRQVQQKLVLDQLQQVQLRVSANMSSSLSASRWPPAPRRAQTGRIDQPEASRSSVAGSAGRFRDAVCAPGAARAGLGLIAAPRTGDRPGAPCWGPPRRPSGRGLRLRLLSAGVPTPPAASDPQSRFAGAAVQPSRVKCFGWKALMGEVYGAAVEGPINGMEQWRMTAGAVAPMELPCHHLI
jgi:hypothetical protein